MMDPSVQAALVANAGLVLVAFLQVRSQRQQARMQQKVEETHHQVTTNSHSSSEPTVLDKIDDVHSEVVQVRHDLRQHLEWHAEVKPGKHRAD